MSVIQAASMSCRTMADGTLRIQADIEPRHAQAAFALFGTPGTPMALARLLTEAEKAAEPTPEPQEAAFDLGDVHPEDRALVGEPMAVLRSDPERVKLGPLALWCVQRCKESEFQAWCRTASEAEARAWVLRQCGVNSRRELDDGGNAAQRFHELVRLPYGLQRRPESLPA